MAASRNRKRGYILLSVGMGAIVLIGAVGLAIDLGRMYIIKGEAQTYADSAAIAAVLELDSTWEGISRARTAVRNNLNRNTFGTAAFSDSDVEFATSAAGPWAESPGTATAMAFVRVTAEVDVPLYFLGPAVSKQKAEVKARAAAGQVPKTSFSTGLFPFSPYAHQRNSPPDFGLQTGRLYTLRWPSNPKQGLGANANMCPGDNSQAMLQVAEAAGGSERGYIEDTSAALIRATIIDDYQSITRGVGDLVNMTGGAKQSQLDSLHTRIQQDSDTTSSTYAQYVTSNTGNGRRVIAAPINDGGTPLGSNNRIVAIGAFFLVPTGQYGNGGNQAWCAEYIGCYLQGSSNRCAVGGGGNSAGAYVARLVE